MLVNYFRNGMHSFTLFDGIDVRYLPRPVAGRPDEYAIYEVYSVRYLQAFLKMDFMKALMAGHSIRRCRNCQRFFLQEKGYRTAYCDRPLADDPKRTCRNQGAKNHDKEKAAGNPVLHSYQRAYQRVTSDKNNGTISEEDWEKAKRAVADLRDMATSGMLTDQQAEERMRSKALYAALDIVKKGGRKHGA